VCPGLRKQAKQKRPLNKDRFTTVAVTVISLIRLMSAKYNKQPVITDTEVIVKGLRRRRFWLGTNNGQFLLPTLTIKKMTRWKNYYKDHMNEIISKKQV
jgi:hypothetical protein